MAAEVRAAWAAQLLATAALTEPSPSENNGSRLQPPVERDSAASCRNQRPCKRGVRCRARSRDSQMSCAFK